MSASALQDVRFTVFTKILNIKISHNVKTSLFFLPRIVLSTTTNLEGAFLLLSILFQVAVLLWRTNDLVSMLKNEIEHLYL